MTAKPWRRRCPYCHEVKPMASGQRFCSVSCAKRLEAREHPERIRIQTRQAVEAHRAKSAARWLQWAERAQDVASLATVLRTVYRHGYRAGLSARRQYEISDGLRGRRSAA